MDIFQLVLASLILAALLAFNYKSDISRFEINRMSAHNHKYKIEAEFLDIYPGLRAFSRLLALITVIILTVLAWRAWELMGGFVAFGAIVAAWLVALACRKIAAKYVSQHRGWFIKYFSWTKSLGVLAASSEELHISSRHELLHIIDDEDFLGDQQKSLVRAAIEFNDKVVADVMTPRDDIVFVRDRDTLGPKLLDELHQSGHMLFPVVHGSLDSVVGTLSLDDVLPLTQDEKKIVDVMRKPVPPLDKDASLEQVVNHLINYHAGQIIVTNSSDKVVGLLAPSDILNVLFSQNVTTE